MNVSYLGHSGFLVESESAFYVFDFIRGTLPGSCLKNAKKPVIFLVSHFHQDHFNPEIFSYRDKVFRPVYIISKDTQKRIRASKRFREEYATCETICLQPDASCQLGDIQIETLRSTDMGVAYLVTEPEGVIFHAGDLNWWDWPGEDEAWNAQMAVDFKKEIDKLKNRVIDLAFFPLDPRQESSYWLGLQYFLENVGVKEVYPMHFWDVPEIMERYEKEHGADFRKGGTLIHSIRDYD